MENTQPRRTGQATPAPYVVEPAGQHKQSIILLHGLGSNGQKFGEALLATGHTSSGESLVRIFPEVRFIFPTSRWRRIKAFKRALLTSWFDIASLDDPHLRNQNQVQGLGESCAEVLELVRREVDAVGAQNVILGGISQGMATSLISLLILDFPIAGYIGISGWLPFCPDMEQFLGLGKDEEEDDIGFETTDDKNAGNSPVDHVFDFIKDLISLPEPSAGIASPSESALTTPAFLGHGTADEKIKLEHGERADGVIRKMGFAVDSKRYEGVGHEYKVPEEIDDIVDFIQRRTGGEKQERTAGDSQHVEIQGLVEGAKNLCI